MKKILALSLASVLTLSVLATTILLGNAGAQSVSTENRTVATMLRLTEIITGQVSDIQSLENNIEDDLLFKQKFWQYPPKKVIIIVDGPILQPGWNVTNVVAVGVRVVECNFATEDPGACAFNVESIQFDNRVSAGFTGDAVPIEGMDIDGVFTDMTEKNITTPTNLMVDTSIGKVGANSHVIVHFGGLYTGPVEFNGEKPQAMELCTTAFIDVNEELVEIPSGQNPCVD
jgi:hypothetical protein